MDSRSELVNARSCSGDSSFGYSWQEAVQNFVVLRDTRVESIENLMSADQSSMLGESELVHIFSLLPAKHLRRVQVSIEAEVIRAMRFFTNRRSSQWIGQRAGRQQTTTFQKMGCYIRLLQGTFSTGRLYQLGVVYTPVPLIHSTKHPVAPTPSVTLVKSAVVGAMDSGRIASFSEEHRVPMAAVIITLSGRSLSVRSLSRVQRERYNTMADFVRPSPREHWFILTSDERILSVSIRCNHERKITCVQLATCKRASPWFGRSDVKDTIMCFDCKQQPEGTSITGFHGCEAVESKAACTLGVVYCILSIE